MPRPLALLIICVALAAVAQSPHFPPPGWAYVIKPNTAAAPPDTKPRHVPNSAATFSPAQVQDPFTPPDWHPTSHPPAPDIVMQGRQPALLDCGYCPLPTGEGRPENSRLAGLPSYYIIRQVSEFRSGARKGSDPRHLPGVTMAKIAAAASDQEVAAAAKYFSELKPEPWIRVVETATVPVTHVAGWMLVPSTPAATEPIGQRIIEVPEDVERTELRDDTSAFIAYVPVGSLNKGRRLVTSRSDVTQPCAECHGPGLRGSGTIPPIAGRSPSYLVRQLYDMQSGARGGRVAKQMRPVVTKLSLDDMIAIVAYVSSLKP